MSATNWILLSGAQVIAIDRTGPFPGSIEVGEIPETGDNQYLEYIDGEFHVRTVVITPPPVDQPDRIAVLEQELAQTRQQLAQTNSDLSALLEMILFG